MHYSRMRISIVTQAVSHNTRVVDFVAFCILQGTCKMMNRQDQALLWTLYAPDRL